MVELKKKSSSIDVGYVIVWIGVKTKEEKEMADTACGDFMYYTYTMYGVFCSELHIYLTQPDTTCPQILHTRHQHQVKR